MKKTNYSTYIIIGLIIIFIFVVVYGGQHEWFKFSVVNNYLPANVNPNTINTITQLTTYTVAVSFVPSTICLGDITTGYINTNMPNGKCTLFSKIGNQDWQQIEAFDLDSAGKYSKSGQINTAGTSLVRTICCDAKSNCKISNEATLTVNNCNQPNLCTDTDGGIKYYIGGKVTTSTGSVYDTCQPNDMDLLEFYCDDLGMKSESGIGCTYGCQEDVNGDYCRTSALCTDSDGGQDDQYNIAGTCSSDVTKTTNADQCNSGYLWEYYCGADNKCYKTEHQCENGWVCIGGKCAQPRCEDIINPTSQTSCNPGYCTAGLDCYFSAATLHSPAKCVCGI